MPRAQVPRGLSPHPGLSLCLVSIVSFVLPECETQAQLVLVNLKVNSNLWVQNPGPRACESLNTQLLRIGGIRFPKTLIVLRLASIILSHSTGSLCYCSSFQGRSSVLGHLRGRPAVLPVQIDIILGSCWETGGFHISHSRFVDHFKCRTHQQSCGSFRRM